MATTARPIEILTLGIRDTTGAVVASGKARWYSPGTLTPSTAFTDDACTTAATAPVTLNAGGQTTLYALEAIRLIVKDSTEATTFYDGVVNLNRHDSVYVTSAGINGGAETTLEAVLTDASTSFGAGFQHRVSASGTARNYVTVLSERCVSVKDFGAVGDGATNDAAACQAAIDYLAALATPGGIVFFPVGTYLINTGLSITTVGISLQGAGRNISVIKNGSTTATAITINVTAADAKLFVRDLGVTASTTSSGTAVLVSSGNHVSIERVAAALHRTGIDCNAVSAAHLLDCYILSTDGNAACIGIRVGARGRVSDSESIALSTNGTGIILNGADGSADGCYIQGFVTGLSCAATNTVAVRCHATVCTTGVSLGGTASAFDMGRVTGCTTGVSVGAVASARVTGVSYATNTTDLSVNSSATNFYEQGNWAVLTAGTATNFVTPLRGTYVSTSGVGTATWTPVHTANSYQHYRASNSGSLTVAAPSGANKMVGDVLFLSVYAAAATLTVTFNSSAYKRPDGTTATAAHALGGNADRVYIFVWDGAVYRLMFTGGTEGSISALG